MQARNILTLVIAFFISETVSAQETDSSTTKEEEKTEFVVSLTYHSSLNYYGRVDSLKSTGIYPYLGLTLKNGLFLTSTFVFINNSIQTEYAATLLEAGYKFKNQKGNWKGSLSGSGFLYKNRNELPQSAVKATGNFSITNLNKIVNITAGADVKYSSQFDFGAMASLDHIIRLEPIFGNDVIVLDPTAAIYAGSQNFTKTYYEQKYFLIFPSGEEEITESSKRFNILAYEFSFPIIYGKGKFNLIFNPAYIIPQNIITVPSQPAISERAEKLFYFTVSGRFTF